MSVVYMVKVEYHPSNPESLEREYPHHVEVAKPLIDAALHVYAGPAGGEIGGKRVTRGVVFIFESKEAWEAAASSPGGAAAIQHAQEIAGPEGMSVLTGEVEVSK